MNEILSLGLFYLLDGLIWGCIIALIALGLSLIFGNMGIINMAHGDLYMAGAVLTLVISKMTGSFWPTLFIVPVLIGVIAMPVERWVLRPFEGKPLISMVAAIGISFIIQQIVLMNFGGTPYMIKEPLQFKIQMFGMGYSGYKVISALVGISAIALFWVILSRTNLGIHIRATMEHQDMADAIGINTNLVKVITFGIGAGMAAFGGVLASPIVSIFYLMGLDMVLFCFIVVIVGGLGNLAGTVVAALLLSGVEGLLCLFLVPLYARAAVLLLMVIIVIIKPKGLFSS